MRVYHEKLGHVVKHLAPKFRPDLSARLKDIAEKLVPSKLKPIVGNRQMQTLKIPQNEITHFRETVLSRGIGTKHRQSKPDNSTRNSST